MSASSLVKLTDCGDDAADICFDFSMPIELVIHWTRVHSSGNQKCTLDKNDSAHLYYYEYDHGVEINKHFIELHIRKTGSEDTFVFVESLHKPVVYYSGVTNLLELANHRPHSKPIVGYPPRVGMFHIHIKFRSIAPRHLTTSVCIMYSQDLARYKHDIAERLVCIGGFLDAVLTTDPDGQDLLRSYHSKTNPVKMMRKVIDHCLETEERAERFIRALRDHDRYLYEELESEGPQGKFVRKDPPVVHVTENARAALGDKVDDLRSMILLPCYSRLIVYVNPALDVLMQYGQLLPEEYAEFSINSQNKIAMIRQLQEMCRDTSIPEVNRQFISLVVASLNMHVFDVGEIMSMEDILVFA